MQTIQREISPSLSVVGAKKCEKIDDKKLSSSSSSTSSDKSKSASVNNSPTVKPPYSYIALSNK
jgi:hypothetical protein